MLWRVCCRPHFISCLVTAVRPTPFGSGSEIATSETTVSVGVSFERPLARVHLTCTRICQTWKGFAWRPRIGECATNKGNWISIFGRRRFFFFLVLVFSKCPYFTGGSPVPLFWMMWFGALIDELLDLSFSGCATYVTVPETIPVTDAIEHFYADSVDAGSRGWIPWWGRLPSSSRNSYSKSMVHSESRVILRDKCAFIQTVLMAIHDFLNRNKSSSSLY